MNDLDFIGPEPPTPTDADCPVRLIKGNGKHGERSGVGPDLDGVVTLLEQPAMREALLEKQGALEFDDKRLVITLDREPVDVEQLACRLRINAQRRFTTVTSKEDVVPLRFRHDAATQGIIYTAKQNPFSSVREFLEGLRAEPAMPGAIAAVAREGLHLCSELDVELLRNFAIGAVARALKPGCKVDCVLVLQGAQGLQKSGALQALAGPENFVDTVMDIDRKDAFLQLHAAWLYEWSELDALKGKELTRVKSFITSQIDTFRAPYDRAVLPHPRTTVICGTTNSDQFLFDATGNRRFCPIRITKRINLTAIRALRNAFWREAVSNFDHGTPWWFDDDSKLQSELAAVQETFVYVDSWQEPVSRHLAMTSEVVTVRGLLRDVLSRNDGNITRADEMRMADVLRGLGWQKGERQTIEGARVTPWTRCGSEVCQ